MLLANAMATGMFLLGSAILAAVLMRRAHRRFKTLPGSQGAIVQLARIDAARASAADPQMQLARIEVQLHDLARELTARIDNKLIALAQLTRDADAKIERLEALLAEAGELATSRSDV